MRLDKYLKVSRLIKRRTVANEACDNGRISVNGRVVKASYDVKVDRPGQPDIGGRSFAGCRNRQKRRCLRHVQRGIKLWLLHMQQPQFCYSMEQSKTAPVLVFSTIFAVPVLSSTPSSATALALDLDRPRMVSSSLS